jgi:5-(carboxyamino)imidazole ribonucleotide synthase
LKTASWGYDGKGQAKLAGVNDCAAAWNAVFPAHFVGDTVAVLEAFVDFACELSVVGARGLGGDMVTYGPMLNVHRNHILDVSSTPVALPAKVLTAAVEITQAIMEKLDVVGVLCAELFLTRNHEIMVNELAPRPHNSGHLTIDAHVSCQFEQQVRAVCGLPLGSAELIRPAAMVNLLGDVWQAGPPQWSKALAMHDVKLHLYGKASARPGRKMGHMTVLANTAEEAIQKALQARALLSAE